MFKGRETNPRKAVKILLLLLERCQHFPLDAMICTIIELWFLVTHKQFFSQGSDFVCPDFNPLMDP